MEVRIKKMLQRLARRIFGQATSGTRNPAPWFVDWIRGSESDSGVTVNGKTALEFAPVWYAVNKIAGNIAQLPLILHAREGDRGRRRAVEHPSYRLLKKRPNALMTAAVFKETLTAHALLQGNGRAAIVRNLRGDPVELIPLLPDRTETVMVEGEKWHLVRITGQSEPQKLRDRDVLHIPGLGYDGIVGYSLIELARNSWGLGMAAEKTSSHHFRNDAMPGAVINAPSGVLTDEAEAETFLHKFRKWHEGISGASRVGLLRDGMTITPMAVTGRDAQWIEQRLFQRQEVALWFLLEQILGDDSSVSYNSLAEKNLAYLTNCLNRWLVKWEEECDEKLLREREKLTDTHYWKFVTGALFKSDVKTTIEAGAQAIAATILSPNEVREWFELNPREGGDEYQNPNTSSQGSGVGGQGSGSEDQARALLADRLTDLIGVEMKRVQAAARKSGNFVSWLDGFYSDARFMKTLARAVLAAGGEEWQVIEHCDASKQQLLDVAGKATPAELVAKVEAAIGAWPARAEALAGEILSGEG